MDGAARPMPDLVDAFRHGTAHPPLPWEPEGRAADNRAVYLTYLGNEWLPAIPTSTAGCAPTRRRGWRTSRVGWVGRASRSRGPTAVVHRRRRRRSGAVRPIRAGDNPGRVPRHGPPGRGAARGAARTILADGGSVLIIDERVADAFAAPAHDLERYHHAWSVVSCLPAAMGDPKTAATGAVMRIDTLRRYAAEAGFGSVEVLAIDTPEWRFYRLHP